jgi:hypothetical protein
MTLNRKYSENVIKLDNTCKCSVCNHSIEYASKTFFEQTGNYIGLDCWENEKERRANERKEKYAAEKAAQYEIDLESNFIADISQRITVNAKLEKCIFLYTSSFGYSEQDVYLNIFRTDDGNIIIYKGKSLFYDYLALFGYDISEVIGMTDPDERMQAHKTYRELYEKFGCFNLHETNYDSMGERQQNYESERTTRDITILKNSDYITLTGTVKKHTIYNDIKQTLIQRPKLK